MGLSGSADFTETRQDFGMVGKVENFTWEAKFSSVVSVEELLARSIYENAAFIRVLSAQCYCCIAIRSCAALMIEKLAEQSCCCSPAVGRFVIEEEKQSMQCSEDEPCLMSPVTRTAISLNTSEEYSPDSCNVCNDDRFLQGPDTTVIMRSDEVKAWIAIAKNKDDDEDEEDDDDDDEEDDDEEDNDDDAEEGSGEEEEGDEELEGDVGDEDEGGEEDDDEGDEGEQGEDGEEGEEEVGDEEEDEDGVEGEEDEDGGDEDDGYDEEEGEEDDDEEDEDEEDKDEASEPPKKKRK